MGSIRRKMFSGMDRFLIREETKSNQRKKQPALTDPVACIFSPGFEKNVSESANILPGCPFLSGGYYSFSSNIHKSCILGM